MPYELDIIFDNGRYVFNIYEIDRMDRSRVLATEFSYSAKKIQFAVLDNKPSPAAPAHTLAVMWFTTGKRRISLSSGFDGTEMTSNSFVVSVFEEDNLVECLDEMGCEQMAPKMWASMVLTPRAKAHLIKVLTDKDILTLAEKSLGNTRYKKFLIDLVRFYDEVSVPKDIRPWDSVVEEDALWKEEVAAIKSGKIKEAV
jgi:hypothetical protein